MATSSLLSAEDIPQYYKPGSGHAYFRYKGQIFSEANFQRAFPQKYAEWQQTDGSGSAIPAGQPGSPYPATLPANSFEAALNLALQERDQGIAKNETRYGQLLSNTGKRIKLVDQSFAGIREGIAQDNARTEAELGTPYQTLMGRIDSLKGGYDAARADVEQVGQLALEEADRSAASQRAVSDADARARGLYSTTVVDAGRRRANEDLSRSKRGIYESIAGLRSGITERGANAVAGAQGDLANFETQRAGINQAGRLRDVDAQSQHMQGAYQALADRAGVIERRLDTYPTGAEIAQLIAEREGAQTKAKADKRNSTLGLIGSVAGGLFGAFCDRRLKVETSRLCDSAVLPGCGVWFFRYTPEAQARYLLPGGLMCGWIAQEVRAVRPEWVTETDDGVLMLVPAAVAAGKAAGELHLVFPSAQHKKAS